MGNILGDRSIGALVFLAGTTLILFISDTLPTRILIVLTFISILGFYISKKTNSRVPFLISVFALGFLHTSIHTNQMRGTIVFDQHEGKDISLIGIIDSVPKLKQFTTKKGKKVIKGKFIFHVESAKDAKGISISNISNIQLSWFNLTKTLRAGQRWKLKVRLKKPVGFANFGGFDYEKWLFSNRVGGVGYVKDGYAAKLLPGSSVIAWNDIIREKVIEKLRRCLPKNDFNGLIMAITTGYREDISKRQWSDLLISGTNHLIAISGLHIGLIAALAFFCCKFLWGAIPILRTIIAPIYIASIGAILAASAYSALAGFSIPTQRALLMVTIVMGAILIRKNSKGESVLATALVCVLLLDPLSVLMPGFWLSFAAVVIIMYTVRSTNNSKGFRMLLWGWIKIQLAISIGLAPLTLLFFDKVSLVSPVVNLVAVPLFSTFIVPILFIAMLVMLIAQGISVYIFELVQWLLNQYWVLIDFVGELEFSTFSCSRIVTYLVLLAFIVALLTLITKRKIVIVLMPLVVIPSVVFTSSLSKGEFDIVFLDVGQGTSVFIKTENHNLIYDTGPNRGLDAGESVIIPFLAASGVSKIDKIVVSHADNDHAGGTKAVVNAIQVGEIISGESLPLINKKANRCSEEVKWEWDGVEFSFIYPFKGDVYRSGNDASCVLLVKSKWGSLLLTGDISKSVERKIIKYYKYQELDIDIISVPHHGSKGSSSNLFLRAVKPKYAVVSSGYRNRYKFPKPKVVSNYKAIGAEVLNTAYSGMITINIRKNSNYKPKRYRLENQKVWMPIKPYKT